MYKKTNIMKAIRAITPYFIIALIVTLAVIALIWLDQETTEWSQVFGHNLMVGLLLYGLPMMLIVSLFYTKLRNYLNPGMSIIISSMGGIPLSTAIMVFIYLMIL